MKCILVLSPPSRATERTPSTSDEASVPVEGVQDFRKRLTNTFWSRRSPIFEVLRANARIGLLRLQTYLLVLEVACIMFQFNTKFDHVAQVQHHTLLPYVDDDDDFGVARLSCRCLYPNEIIETLMKPTVMISEEARRCTKTNPKPKTVETCPSWHHPPASSTHSVVPSDPFWSRCCCC
jgi:hypothetical protein